MNLVDWFDLIMDFWMSIAFPGIIIYLMLKLNENFSISLNALSKIEELRLYVQKQLKDREEKDGK